MQTYQELATLGQDERARCRFVRELIEDYQRSPEVREAIAAEAYHNGENPTIMRLEKILYDMKGMAHRDEYTANHKIPSCFFGFAVDQSVSYLLGNGVNFGDEDTKKRLGADFDLRMMDAAEYAEIEGAAFGFWNMDHLEIFRRCEFAPLYDEDTGALRAGVRFWRLAPERPLRATLYEPDGFTEYIWRGGGVDGEIRCKKRAYVLTVRKTPADGEEIVDGTNYAALPIVPLYVNRTRRSELHGKRNTLDALDLVTSKLVDNVDEGNLIYWIIKNAGGMDELDDAQFVERVKLLHVAHADGDAEPDARSIEAPFEGTQQAIATLTARLYTDFQCFDPASVTAANQSATAIKAAYAPLDLKTDRIEREVTRFILGVLRLAGIEDAPTYVRNQLANTYENVQAVVLAAPYLTEEYATAKLLSGFGDIDRLEEVLRQRSAEGLGRLAGTGMMGDA